MSGFLEEGFQGHQLLFWLGLLWLYGKPFKKEKFVRALFLAVEALESISKRHKDMRQRGGEAEAGPARSV